MFCNWKSTCFHCRLILLQISSTNKKYKKMYKYNKQFFFFFTKENGRHIASMNKIEQKNRIHRTETLQVLTLNLRKVWSYCSMQNSFTLGLVANRHSYLTLDVLFLAIHNKQQRRVHSYTSEVK